MSLLRKPKLDERRKTLLLFAASLLLALPCVAAASFALNINVDPQDSTFEDKRLKPIYRAEPEYPQDARERKVEGTVRLLVTVDPKGSVQDVEVTKPVFPSLDESAAKAVRKWQFAPYYLNGEAVSRKLVTEVNFNINSWQQDKSKEEQERGERERVEREREKSGQDAEMQYKRELEMEFKAKAQAELARHARISMDQAIQIATSKYPGTVLNCSLNAEHWEKPGVLAAGSDVFYHVVIVSTNENDDGPTHVLVSATDGRIVKSEKEKRRERGIGVSRLPINGGVLNGKAISLPAPVYPEIARQADAEGTVAVEVVIDEEGNVIEARAASGHPLLQSAAVNASREAKFSPTRLEGEPVRVRGVITYNFVRN
jgi:TonB family protein